MTCMVTAGVCPVGRDISFLSPGHTSMPYTHISTLLFSKPLSIPRPFFYPAPCLHIRVTLNGGTYLPLTSSELEGQDKALGTE